MMRYEETSCEFRKKSIITTDELIREPEYNKESRAYKSDATQALATETTRQSKGKTKDLENICSYRLFKE